MTTSTQLYRHFDSGDQLLYVGISKSAFSRFVQHIGSSEWSKLAVKMTVENYRTREEALDAEAIAIRTESPRWNKHYTGEKSRQTHGFVRINLDVLDDLGELSFRSPATRRLLNVLLKSMGKNNEVKLRQDELIEMSGLSRPSVQRAVAALKSQNWLSVKKNGTSNIYEINSQLFCKA